MTSETLARAETPGQAGGPGGEGGLGARHDGVWVSMVLTLTPNRDCTPVKNRRIPTIPAGRTDVGPAHVSAVDTGPRRSESGVLAAQPGASVTGPPPPSPDRRLSWGTEAMTRLWPRPEWARVGLLHEGRDPLTKGCAYCTKAPPTRSAPDPRPVTPTPRAVHPDDDGSHHSDRGSPSPADRSSRALPSGRPAPDRCFEMS